MKKIIAIVGPTASGKSGFAVRLAKEIGAEIISGDSIQVYRGFTIGSGKIVESEMEGVKHHLIDIKEPRDRYSVKEFQSLSRDIMDHSSCPIVFCGGTGLYLKAALFDYEFPEEEESTLDFSDQSTESLYQRLVEVDPVQAQSIHPNNRQRIERSLTIFEKSGTTQSSLIEKQDKKPLYDIRWIGIDWNREVLYERINQRVHRMMVSGLKEEIESLLDKGSSFDDLAMKGIGYREWKEYFEGSQSLEETEYLIQRNSRHFAKRQLTWFRNQVPMEWVKPENLDHCIQDLKDWLSH